MIEVKCNGKTYLFNEGSEIQDHLDMTAAEVREDPDPALPAKSGNMLYTHDVAAAILERFEDLLDDKNIRIPCSDMDEESDRGIDENDAAIYGTEYGDLLDGVESDIIEAVETFKSSGTQDYVKYAFSGNR